MKIITCLVCGEWFSPAKDQTWRFCPPPCEHSGVRWRDPRTGQLEVSYVHGPDDLRIIGLNNSFFAAAVDPRTKPKTDDGWRVVHRMQGEAAAGTGYLFGADRRDCWALIVRVGESGDVHVVPWNEAHAAYEAQREPAQLNKEDDGEE